MVSNILNTLHSTNYIFFISLVTLALCLYFYPYQLIKICFYNTFYLFLKYVVTKVEDLYV